MCVNEALQLHPDGHVHVIFHTLIKVFLKSAYKRILSFRSDLLGVDDALPQEVLGEGLHQAPGPQPAAAPSPWRHRRGGASCGC